MMVACNCSLRYVRAFTLVHSDQLLFGSGLSPYVSTVQAIFRNTLLSGQLTVPLLASLTGAMA